MLKLNEDNAHKTVCYTVGHSNHDISVFIELLNKHEIEKIIDVRSVPYSKYVPEYNRDELNRYLEREDIDYEFKGDTLGARHTDEKFLTNSKVDFSKVRKDEYYKESIKKLVEEIKGGSKISLMCSEKNPFNCHRFVLVSYSLKKMGVNVKHILGDGGILSNEKLEEKLLSTYGLDFKQTTLFGEKKSKKEALETAYKKRNFDISYSVKR